MASLQTVQRINLTSNSWGISLLERYSFASLVFIAVLPTNALWWNFYFDKSTFRLVLVGVLWLELRFVGPSIQIPCDCWIPESNASFLSAEPVYVHVTCCFSTNPFNSFLFKNPASVALVSFYSKRENCACCQALKGTDWMIWSVVPTEGWIAATYALTPLSADLCTVHKLVCFCAHGRWDTLGFL